MILIVQHTVRDYDAWKPVFDSLETIVKSKSDSVVGDLREAWPITKREGYLGNFLADAIREESGSDIGLWPASDVHAGLRKGKVTVGDLWKAIGPFEQVSVFDLPGSEVKRLVRYQFHHSTDFIFLSGATCTADSSVGGGPESQVFVNGKPVQGGDHYRIAIPQSVRDRYLEYLKKHQGPGAGRGTLPGPPPRKK